jgi:hypothetical protein
VVKGDASFVILLQWSRFYDPSPPHSNISLTITNEKIPNWRTSYVSTFRSSSLETITFPTSQQSGLIIFEWTFTRFILDCYGYKAKTTET